MGLPTPNVERAVASAAGVYDPRLSTSKHPGFIDCWPMSGRLCGYYVTVFYAEELTPAEVEAVTSKIRRSLDADGFEERDVALTVTHDWGDMARAFAEYRRERPGRGER